MSRSLQNYPMRTIAEAKESIVRAAQDRMALRISEETYKLVKGLLQSRINQKKKQALYASAAKLGGSINR